MPAIARSGVHFQDPREFYRLLINSNAMTNYTQGGVGALSTTANFFTEQDLRGVTDDTNWSADTYKTILSVASGMGIVGTMIGPTGLAGTPTTTFEVTVDGVLNTVAVVASTTGQRATLGPVVSGTSVAGGFLTTSVQAQQGLGAISADKSTQIGSSNVFETMPWSLMRLLGTPGLIYRQSLLIRMKSSEANSTTTNKERRSVVQYMVMA